MKTLIIANPEAGSLDDRRHLEELVASLDDARLRFTENEGDAGRFAAEAVGTDVELLVAAGGDGTLNAVFNGASEGFGRLRFGLLPLGTGNDFARSIRVSEDLDEAIALLVDGPVAKIDAARAETSEIGVRYFLNSSAAGAPCEVSDTLDSDAGMKESWGPLAYLRSAVSVASDIPSYEARLTFDDDEVLELTVSGVLVANGHSVAHGVRAAPAASLDDGLLDVLVIPELTRPQLAVLAAQVLTGSHLGSDLVHYRRARRLHVESSPPIPFNLDGEVCGTGPVTYELLPGALEMVVGPKPKKEGERE